MVEAWLALPLPALVIALVLFFGGIAALLVFLSFGRASGPAIQSFKGVVAPFVGPIAAMLAILVGFLASDISDRDRRAVATVNTEADQLLALDTLAATFNLPRAQIDAAIRSYAAIVVQKEWPSMARRQVSPEAERALDELLKTIDNLRVGESKGEIDRLMYTTALSVRSARSARLVLAQDQSAGVKWYAVLALAIMAQISTALVHLDRLRPQIAAQTVLTVSLVVVLGLLAAHELPFAPPLAVSSAPIARLLDVLPAG
ncbi:MAG TPA: hypothetical protein VKV77_10260 [Methylovirgula sp.]|nr:hypothetical protein [Methylovirgula sp.]